MNRMSRRLTYTFIVQIVFVTATLAIGSIAFLVYIGLRMQEAPDVQYITSESRRELQQTFSVDADGQVRLDLQSGWAAEMKKRGGWLQVLEGSGRAAASYNVPQDVPGQYEPGALVSVWQKNSPSPYDLTVSKEEKNGRTFFVVVGKKSPAKELFQQLRAEWDGTRLSQQGEQLVHGHAGALRIYNAGGQLVHAYGGEKEAGSASAAITLDALLGDEADARRASGQEYVYYDDAARQTWLVEANAGSAPGATKAPYPDDIGRLFSIYGAAVLLFALLVAIGYARRFGRPFRYMIDFVQQLSEGNYNDRPTAKERSYLHDRRGRLKRPYRFFREVNDSLNGLRTQLQQNELLRAQMERTREEWIVGVSHDLKTPLSSINGYAHLLESAPYRWSDEELQTIGRTMREKSGFISELIDDLSLTYRLKNNALPLERKLHDVNEIVRRAVVHFINDPRYEAYEIAFHSSKRPVRYPLDPKWFTRIIDNMISNAIKHNPPNTRIDIAIRDEDGARFRIVVRDNGVGMDRATLNNLFDRYYRGTNTEENTSGSGLGMSIAKQLTLAHDGEISVASQEGKGTEIVLRFQNGPI